MFSSAKIFLLKMFALKSCIISIWEFFLIFYFRVDHKTEEDSKAYEAVKGSLSTKIEAVVKTLIKIRNDDPTAKSLVFSTWNSVLDILESALQTNDIQFATLHVQGKFKRNLQKFKVWYATICISYLAYFYFFFTKSYLTVHN